MEKQNNKRQVVVAEYSFHCVFKIPKGLDLDNKKVVEDWWVKYDILSIKYVNNEEIEEIPFSRELSREDFKNPVDERIENANDGYMDYFDGEEEDESVVCLK